MRSLSLFWLALSSTKRLFLLFKLLLKVSLIERTLTLLRFMGALYRECSTVIWCLVNGSNLTVITSGKSLEWTLLECDFFGRIDGTSKVKLKNLALVTGPAWNFTSPHNVIVTLCNMLFVSFFLQWSPWDTQRCFCTTKVRQKRFSTLLSHNANYGNRLWSESLVVTLWPM